MRPPNPIHPGEILLEEFIKPMGVTQREFARRLGWTTAKLSELLHARRGVTAHSALDLAARLKTTPELWLTLQMHYDLHQARQKRKAS
jgi:addiction module HigA family antidote